MRRRQGGGEVKRRWDGVKGKQNKIMRGETGAGNTNESFARFLPESQFIILSSLRKTEITEDPPECDIYSLKVQRSVFITTLNQMF